MAPVRYDPMVGRYCIHLEGEPKWMGHVPGVLYTLTSVEAGLTFGSSVYLAGGAIRDIALGRHVKDLDFFVFGGGVIAAAEAALSWRNDGQWGAVDTALYGNVSDVRSLWTVPTILPLFPTIQVVELSEAFTGETPWDLLARFDLGFCQAFLDVSFPYSPKVGHTEAFLKDIQDRTMTVVLPEGAPLYRYTQTEARIRRLQHKYPGFCPVAPSWFWEAAKDGLEEYNARLGIVA